MEKRAGKIKRIAILAGALCAYWIGAGFATGQEALQYFAVNGLKGLLGSLITMALIVTMVSALFSVGNKMQFKNPYQVFEYYCGPWLGKVYIWYNVILIYCVFTLMLSGAGSTINQYFGIPKILGTATIAVCVLGTALLGIEKLIQIIGRIGPVEIFCIFIVGAVAFAAFIRNPDLLIEHSKRMGDFGFYSASPNWAWSGALYAFGTLVSAIPFLVNCGASAANLKEARISAVTGSMAFAVAIVLIVIAEIVYCYDIAGRQVPTLAIANYISPVLGLTFAVLIVVCIYSSASSLLVMTVRKFVQERNRLFYILTVGLVVAGAFLGGLLPFGKLLNIIYPLAGYSAMLFILLAAVKMIRDKVTKVKRNKEAN